MTYLIDTHVLLWAAYQDDLLSAHARATLASGRHEVLVSAATAWEIATKHRLGKLPDAAQLAKDFVATVTAAGYLLLPISVEHALRAGRLVGEHKDPFDRMLCAQAIHENYTLISADTQLDNFGIQREW